MRCFYLIYINPRKNKFFVILFEIQYISNCKYQEFLNYIDNSIANFVDLDARYPDM